MVGSDFTIAASEIQNFSGLIPTLYTPNSITDFPSHILSCLAKFIDLDEPPQDLVQPYQSIAAAEDPLRDLAMARPQQQEPLASLSIEEYLKSFADNCEIDRTAVTKISNVVSKSDSHYLEGSYWRLQQSVSPEHRVTKIFSDFTHRATTHAVYLLEGDLVALTVNRDRHNYTEQRVQRLCQRDRYLLNLIDPHITQSYQNAIAFTLIQEQLDRRDRVLEESGTVLLSPDGQVQLMTKRAWKLLNQYFAKCSAHQLPQVLQQWLYQQISLLVNNSLPSPSSVPLHVGESIQKLTINLMPAPDGEQYLLRLKEHQAGSFSIDSLQLLGLTRREAEVLWLIAKDLSNPDIAESLQCSLSTVKKHLEHIYEKLEVQTRTAAVMTALVQLGLISS